MDIFSRLLIFFYSLGNTEEGLKKKRLLIIKKTMSKSRYKKFYKVSTIEALPAMASFFLHIYNSVAGLRRCLSHPEKSLNLRRIVFNHFIDVEQGRLLRELSPEVIELKAGEHDLLELSNLIEEDIKKVKKGFNASWICTVDKTYNQIILFSWLVNFDYINIFERFGVHNINEKQHFKKVGARLVIESIKDFLAIIEIINPDTDWKTIFDILKKIDETIPGGDQWFEQKEIIQDVLNSKILTLIVQKISEDPEWENKMLSSNTDFAESMVNDYIKGAKKSLSDVIARDEGEKVNKMARKIFGSEWVSCAQYYTDKNNAGYLSKGYSGFTHAWQFNFVLSFLFKFNDNIKDIANIFLIKGFWVNRAFASELSLIILNLGEVFQKLSAFDQALKDQGEYDVRLSALLTKAAIGKRHEEQLERYLYQINDEAKELTSLGLNTLSHLCTYFHNLKLEEDSDLRSLIRNWDELSYCKKDLMPVGECIEKIEKLISLIQFIDTLNLDTATDQTGKRNES
jgi:hypothetical protein